MKENSTSLWEEVQNHTAKGMDRWILKNWGHFGSQSTTFSFYNVSSTRGRTSVSTCHAPHTDLTTPLQSVHNSQSVFGVFIDFLKSGTNPFITLDSGTRLYSGLDELKQASAVWSCSALGDISAPWDAKIHVITGHVIMRFHCTCLLSI